MIMSFGDAATRELFFEGQSRKWGHIAKPSMRRLAMLHRAESIEELRIPPSNRLKPLHGDYSGWHSIRINDQYRICFIWRDGHAHGVIIVDYH
ncbi:type II toxin-antitoxin system RelE/ParE family toxin [Luteibacter sp. 9135]|uniref:type II toxin-antitoxin system RelE/ParE family toxin n=1 Tax=Luteibacter sp. 9135 TaxID=1500893 RepID=UPI0005632302|nr:type II toxin-antitoxin system RelE/ParE family toxin [Luteibacter sp. 9135]